MQLAQGVVARRTLSPYERSYWLVTYQAGFTRRGLAGELIRILTGSVATVPEIEALQWLLTSSLVIAVGLVVIAALRRNTLSLDLAAIALCCSPFVFDFIVSQRRPDQLGLVVVVGYGLVLYMFPRWAFAAAVLAGVALAVAVGVEDSVFLQCVPWAAVLTLAAASTRPWSARNVGRVAVLCALPTIVAATSVFAGRLDARGINVLLSAARKDALPRGDGTGVFGFLGDDLLASVDHVTHLPLSVIVGSIGVCAVLIILQGLLMLGFEVPHLRSLRDGGTHTLALGLAVVASLAALVVLLALGIDWTRWVASFGLMASVTATLGLLYRNTAPEPERRRMNLIPVIIVATYLLWLAPLPDALGIRGGLHYLLMTH